MIQWLKNIFAPPINEQGEDEAYELVADLLHRTVDGVIGGPFQIEEIIHGNGRVKQFHELPPAIQEYYNSRAREAIKVLREFPAKGQISKSAEDCIQLMRNFRPKDPAAQFEVIELTNSVKAVYTTGENTTVELESNTKSGKSVEMLMVRVEQFLGERFLDIV